MSNSAYQLARPSFRMSFRDFGLSRRGCDDADVISPLVRCSVADSSTSSASEGQNDKEGGVGVPCWRGGGTRLRITELTPARSKNPTRRTPGSGAVADRGLCHSHSRWIVRMDC